MLTAAGLVRPQPLVDGRLSPAFGTRLYPEANKVFDDECWAADV
jgi:hypothetical protein